MNQMKSTQLKKEKKNEEIKNNTLKNGIIASIIGLSSWIAIFFVFDPLAGLYKFNKTYYAETFMLLKNSKFYITSIFIVVLFFLFFYVTLKYKEKSSIAKIVMWLGIILYGLFYLGYLFLLFFFRFTDL